MSINQIKKFKNQTPTEDVGLKFIYSLSYRNNEW